MTLEEIQLDDGECGGVNTVRWREADSEKTQRLMPHDESTKEKPNLANSCCRISREATLHIIRRQKQDCVFLWHIIYNNNTTAQGIYGFTVWRGHAKQRRNA